MRRHIQGCRRGQGMFAQKSLKLGEVDILTITLHREEIASQTNRQEI